MLDPDMAYCFPNPDGITLAAAMIDKGHHDSFKKDLAVNLDKFIGRLPNAPDFSKAEPIGPVHGMYDLSLYVRKAGGNGLAFVGDAALTTDPIAGAGCGWALQSAEWLVDLVTPALRALSTREAIQGATREAELEPALQNYATLHAKNLHSHQKIIARYSTGQRFLTADGALFSLLARNSRFQQWFHAVYSRNIQPAMPALLAFKLLYRSLWSNPRTDLTDYNWNSFALTDSEQGSA